MNPRVVTIPQNYKSNQTLLYTPVLVDDNQSHFGLSFSLIKSA